MKLKKIKHSFATYKKPGETAVTRVRDLAKALLNWGDIPKSLNDLRASEISMLAREYLALEKAYKKLLKESK